jgi:shikimate kinase
VNEVGPLRTPRIVLVGMMGSGKTSVGRALARRTGWPYHDNDDELLRARSVAARDLLAASDEATLRKAEVAALEALLALPVPCIVAAAAGTIVDPLARARIAAAGLVVWLRVAPGTILSRAAPGGRPWRPGDRAAWVANAVRERDSLYAEIADLVLDADRQPVERLVDAILERVA